MFLKDQLFIYNSNNKILRTKNKCNNNNNNNNQIEKIVKIKFIRIIWSQ